ncbi:OmpA family protein [Salegentibacter chungangensis]|uniref:OmpA family protein n=1 Tax=Salegentibacter chungangensis TaxID=1335724 RepID=A0ABW3NQZ2_9FLAO
MKNFYTTILLLLVSSLSLQAQSSKQKKADRLYDELAYLEATNVYKELIEKEYNVQENKLRLGDAYMKLRSPENAVHYYGDVLENEGASPEYYYKYAQALRGVKRYDESKKWLQKYLNEGAGSKDVSELMEDPDYEAKDIYRLESAGFNSAVSDFGVFKKDNTIYFVSARAEGVDVKTKTYSWNGEPYLDIYQMNADSGEISPISGDINTKLHDGPIVISPDGNTAYFTRNNYMGNKEGKRDKDATNHLKIYKAQRSGDSWTNVSELPFNSDSYSVGHPALSQDGKTLYFTSDMPGGQGGTDIYKISLDGNGFGSPENLGAAVNTEFDEAFPFIDEEGVLYFSSNGHGGYGLYDIYSYDLNEGGKVENLGEPVNSNLDDFAYFRSGEDNTGFVSSNREGNSDNIFAFNRLEPLMLEGKVTDAVNDTPVAKATVRLMDENNKQIAFLETNEEGDYSTEIDRDKIFPVEAKQIEYETFHGKINTTDSDDKEKIVYNIQLQPVKDVEYLAEIDNIYFDFDKSNIRPDAAKELDKLVALMKNEYPDLVIEIGSHTDFRGSNEYNQALAERRAKSTYDYLISKGIDKNRIQSYKGYGETRPAIECDRCTREEHQLNRRSMFKVVKME